MKHLFFYFLLAVSAPNLAAQDFHVPRHIELEEDEDYADYEEDIVECVNWLINTPFKKSDKKRSEAMAFLVQWVEGAPNVMVSLNSDILTFVNTESEALIVFMGAWAVYSIENDAKDDVLNNTMAALDGVMKYYENNSGVLIKDKNIEKYIKLRNEKKLQAHVEKLLEKK
jgi:hypothetical protein